MDRFTEAAAGWSVVLRCSCQVRSSSNSGDGMDTSSPDAAITTKTQVGIATVASASQQSLFADMPGLQGLPPNSSHSSHHPKTTPGSTYTYKIYIRSWSSRFGCDPKPVRPSFLIRRLSRGSIRLPLFPPPLLRHPEYLQRSDIAGAHPIPSSLLTTLALPTLLSLTKYHNALDAESDYADLRNVMKPALSKGSDVEMMRVLGLGLKGTKGPFDVIVGGDGDGNVGAGIPPTYLACHRTERRLVLVEGPLEDFILPEMKPEECTKSTDVWFDSGTSWSMLDALPSTGRSHRADVCMEGSDQHRGWFQIGSRSVVESDAVAKGLRPYGTLITHGMVLAEKGKKMSKSLAISLDKKKDPAYGADLLRFWAASIEYKNDMSIGRTSLSQTAEAMHKIRNSARFVLGNIMDGDVLRDFERVERNNMGFVE
ncbi:hypothetical protein D9757_009399 [Collybiopsis confluens]|uniref:Aminoacyl-tRNA synthetase class Ia domain-containing protein n=1 Tax=Collybiopsis confluens TaxID=2823264 RepID=A0A8H5H795_9AGAR|nr:hypothetical protein D9757_009399 [Collybiopsis confluens]